eukprot:15069763-Ditylum_brightwellii.AAC.1
MSRYCVGGFSPRCGVTAYVKETSRSAKPSGRSAYGMLSGHTNYRSRYAEQFVKTHASGLDPA